MKRLFTLFIFIICLFQISFVSAAETTVYVSDDATGNVQGSDSNDGLSIPNAFKSISRVNTYIGNKAEADIVNVLFDRSDTWDFQTDVVSTTTHWGVDVWSGDPTVHVNAYGSGNKPIFDGGVSDFSTVPEHNTSTGPFLWSDIFYFRKTGCSIQNVDIRNVYGCGITANGNTIAERPFTLDVLYCDISDCGRTGILISHYLEGCEVAYNTTVRTQLLFLNDKQSIFAWGSAINVTGTDNYSRDNHIHHNSCHDSAGEGITGFNGIVEYNLIGDTYSVGIFGKMGDPPGEIADWTCRYNLVVSSDETIYKQNGFYWAGIAYEDDQGASTSDGTDVDINIYGNIVIHRKQGFLLIGNDGSTPADNVRIYNNIAIDCYITNYAMSLGANIGATGAFYNNSSILFDRDGTGTDHIVYETYFPAAGWTVDNNHFYEEDGELTCTSDIDGDFNTNCVDGDPLIPGEDTVDWTTLAHNLAANDMIDISDLYHSVASALYGTGKDLSVIGGFDTEMMGPDTDFDDWPSGSGDDEIETNNNESIGPFYVTDIEASGTVFTQIEGNITETDIAAGNETIIFTITGTTFNTLDNTIRAAIVAGMDSDQGEATGWDALIKADPASWSATGVVLTNSTTITVTLPVSATYAIIANEIITSTIPATAIVSAEEIVASPDVIISNESEGTVTGGKNIIHDPDGQAWIAASGSTPPSPGCDDCTGTPDFFWDGEVGGDTDKAYISDGCSSTQDGTADVDFHADYAYCGDIGMLFNHNDDDIYWTITAGDIWDSSEGTITIRLRITGITGIVKLIYMQGTPGEDILNINMQSNRTVYFFHTGDSNTVSMTSTNVYPIDEWFELKVRWSVSENKIGVNIAGQGWEDDADGDTVTAWLVEPASIWLGPRGLGFNTTTMEADNFQSELTYEE